MGMPMGVYGGGGGEAFGMVNGAAGARKFWVSLSLYSSF